MTISESIILEPQRDAVGDRWGWQSLALLGIVLFAGVGASFLLSAFHDEMHFTHAAWMAQQGERPFTDFMFHNPLGILWLLNIYGWIDPNYGPEILFFGRGLAALSLVVVALGIYRLARLAATPMWATYAAASWVIYVMIPLDGTTMRKHLWSIRPEVYAAPLVVLGFCWLLGLNKRMFRRGSSETPTGAWLWEALLCGLSLGVGVGISLRAAVITAAAFVAAYVLQTRPRKQIVFATVTGAAVAILIYAVLYGWQNSWVWINKYSAALRSDDVGYFHTIRMLGAKFLVLYSIPCAIYMLVPAWWNSDRKISPQRQQMIRCVAFVQLLQLPTPFMEPSPGFPAWQFLSIFAAVCSVVALGLALRNTSVLSRRLGWLYGILLLLTLGYQLRLVRNYQMLVTTPLKQLSTQVDAFQRFCEVFKGEPYSGMPNYHPIALPEPSYVWTQHPQYDRFSQSTYEFVRHHYLDELLQNPPVIIKVAESSLKDARFVMLLNNYDALGKEWYVRSKDHTRLNDPRIQEHAEEIGFHMMLPLGMPIPAHE
jgi:hypothetical protein